MDSCDSLIKNKNIKQGDAAEKESSLGTVNKIRVKTWLSGVLGVGSRDQRGSEAKNEERQCYLGQV